MPHLTLEYTKNLNRFDPDEVLTLLNTAVFESGQFEEAAIKSRAIELKHSALGITQPDRRFLALKVAILQGRSPDVRRELAARLMDVLRGYLKGSGDSVSASVEITEVFAETYVKETIS